MTRITPHVASSTVPLATQPSALLAPLGPKADKIHHLIQTHAPSLDHYVALYKRIHADPCLSFREHATADLVVSHLTTFHDPAFIIKRNIGTTGIAAILRNGSGRTVLLRADMDALPVREATGLAYASTKIMKDLDGVEQPVMHACGHDMHVTSLLACSSLLHAAHASWRGTLVCLFQQAEERGGGAQQMIDDGLYDPQRHAVPVPDVCLGGHVLNLPTGQIRLKQGTALAASDSLEITLHGRGGHASMPHTTVDPVLLAAHVIVRLQGIVSREVDPLDSAVVTVSSVHAGAAENIIVDTAVLKANVRTYAEEVRTKVLAAIRRVVQSESEASASPKPAEFRQLSSFPVTVNDGAGSARVGKAFEGWFGDRYAENERPLQGSEDFSILGTAVGVPTVFWFYGGVDAEEWKRREKNGSLAELPGNHSALFAPVIRPTLDTAMEALALGALEWLVQ